MKTNDKMLKTWVGLDEMKRLFSGISGRLALGMFTVDLFNSDAHAKNKLKI